MFSRQEYRKLRGPPRGQLRPASQHSKPHRRAIREPPLYALIALRGDTGPAGNVVTGGAFSLWAARGHLAAFSRLGFSSQRPASARPCARARPCRGSTPDSRSPPTSVQGGAETQIATATLRNEEAIRLAESVPHGARHRQHCDDVAISHHGRASLRPFKARQSTSLAPHRLSAITIFAVSDSLQIKAPTPLSRKPAAPTKRPPREPAALQCGFYQLS